MRRFFAQSSGVLLVATGFSPPNPEVLIRSAGTPAFTSKLFSVSARSTDTRMSAAESSRSRQMTSPSQRTRLLFEVADRPIRDVINRPDQRRPLRLQVMLPATRITNTSPNPWSKMISGVTRESLQARIVTKRCGLFDATINEVNLRSIGYWTLVLLVVALWE
jgi:hypothetical protein